MFLAKYSISPNVLQGLHGSSTGVTSVLCYGTLDILFLSLDENKGMVILCEKSCTKCIRVSLVSFTQRLFLVFTGRLSNVYGIRVEIIKG